MIATYLSLRVLAIQGFGGALAKLADTVAGELQDGLPLRKRARPSGVDHKASRQAHAELVSYPIWIYS